MTASMVNATITAVVAALERAPAVVPVVDRVRLRPVSKQLAEAIAVRPVQAEPTQRAIAPGVPVRWESTFTVEIYQTSAAGVAPDDAVDPLVTAAYARLMEDPSLGGACIALEPKGISYDFDSDGTQSTCVSLVFVAVHRPTGATFT